VFARQRQELLHVFHDVLARQQELQLAEPRGISFELLAEEGFHAGALVQSVGAGQWVLRAMARAVAVLAWPASVRRLERH
jgi:hypothetical protein